MPVSDSDELLLNQFRQGDDGAFEALFLHHYDQVYRVLYGLVGGREEAEDLAQETFLSLYHQLPQPEPGASLSAWLCRVCPNRVYRAINQPPPHSKRYPMDRAYGCA